MKLRCVPLSGGRTFTIPVADDRRSVKPDVIARMVGHRLDRMSAPAGIYRIYWQSPSGFVSEPVLDFRHGPETPSHSQEVAQ